MVEIKEFQSTHPCRVRPNVMLIMSGGVFCFNPRTRVGCDLQCCIAGQLQCCFNPRTRVGCDFWSLLRLLSGFLFQSTHPCRVRLQAARSCNIQDSVSIHAPV